MISVVQTTHREGKTMTASATITEVLDYVHARADEQDLDSLLQALRTRRKVLGEQRAATVRSGLEIRLDGLSPKYLNGLTGTVVTLDGNRAEVRLDERSTTQLRGSGRRFYVPAGEIEYLLTGIPKSCCLAA